MNRHLALTFAGAAAIVVTTVSGAVAANVGILNVGAEKPVGQLTAANVGQLAASNSVRSTPSPATESGTSVDGSVGGASVDPAEVERARDNLDGSLALPKSNPAGTAGFGSSATGPANGTPSGFSSPTTAPREGNAQGPSVTAPAPSPSPPTTSRSSHDNEDDHEEGVEYEEVDDD